MTQIRKPIQTVRGTRSLSFRLYLIIVPTTFLAITLISYLNSEVAARLLEWEIEAGTVQIAGQLAEDLARPDSLLGKTGMHTWLAELVETNSYVVRIDVFQLKDGILTRTDTTSITSAAPMSVDEMAAVQQSQSLVLEQFHDREPILKAIVPIKAGTGSISGCVSVFSSLHQANLVNVVRRRIDLFLIPASVLTLVLLLHYLFTRELAGRIRRLGFAMTEARSGSLEKRAPVDRPDELGTIARLFNETMAEIERASRDRNRLLEEQKGFNTQLTQKVQEATLELSAANNQLRQANQDLLETQQRLTRYERLAVAGQMAATFAHEIGSPLSAISTQLELMAEEPTCSEEARNRVRLIQEQVSRITGFVEELLSETRAAVQARTRVQLNDLLARLTVFLAQHLERHHIVTETRFQPGLAEVNANAQQLQQVFLNLLNNAVDAMPKGGTIVLETGSETDEKGREWVIVSVTDDGTGMSPDEQKRIFEPFFSTKDFRQGTGLGLSIAARIVRQHEGRIELTSRPGAGSTFALRFPAVRNEPSNPRKEP